MTLITSLLLPLLTQVSWLYLNAQRVLLLGEIKVCTVHSSKQRTRAAKNEESLHTDTDY